VTLGVASSDPAETYRGLRFDNPIGVVKRSSVSCNLLTWLLAIKQVWSAPD
jgi:hypothetical protein